MEINISPQKKRESKQDNSIRGLHKTLPFLSPTERRRVFSSSKGKGESWRKNKAMLLSGGAAR